MKTKIELRVVAFFLGIFVLDRVGVANAYFATLGMPRVVVSVERDREFKIEIPQRDYRDFSQHEVLTALTGWTCSRIVENPILKTEASMPSNTIRNLEEATGKSGLHGSVHCQNAGAEATPIDLKFHCPPLERNWLSPIATMLRYAKPIKVAEVTLPKQLGSVPTEIRVLCDYRVSPSELASLSTDDQFFEDAEKNGVTKRE